tara:strand:+ start:723 stop:1166 length:444 start_codon:yes stop_codon:yes gene_type:complete
VYAIKTEIRNIQLESFDFVHQKTMYGGKKIAAGDIIYLFASENEGGAGLVAKGIVISATETPRKTGVERQTPKVSITVRRTAFTQRVLGRENLKPYKQWDDGRPESELNFKFYRQATNKIVGLSQEAAAFLEAHFNSSVFVHDKSSA